jgi:putative colanic acid biosynthesis UDP-glucose lipid carrier transferase
MALDFFLIFFACVVGSALYELLTGKAVFELRVFIGSSIFVSAIFVSLSSSRGLYRIENLVQFDRHILVAVTKRWFAAIISLVFISYLLKVGAPFSRISVFAFAVIGFGFLVLDRLFWRFILARSLATGKLKGRDVVVLGQCSPASAIERLKAIGEHDFNIVAQYEIPLEQGCEENLAEAIGNIARSVRGSDIEEVLVLLNWDQLPAMNEIQRQVRIIPYPVRLIPDQRISNLVCLPSRSIGRLRTIELQRPPLNYFERLQKRGLDLLLASLCLMLFSPLCLLTAIFIKLDSPGPVFFRQSRRGFNGKPFKIIKFRSMYVQEDGDVVRQARRNDPRVTQVGKWIRRTSIDELPQFWNVLYGDMSIVGPRPHAVSHDNFFDRIIENYAFRHHVKPGITGWAQVHGYRGETTTELMEKRIELDVEYVNKWNIFLDLRVIVGTVFELIRNRETY